MPLPSSQPPPRPDALLQPTSPPQANTRMHVPLPVRIASFDLGSNSTLCLIAELDEHGRLRVLKDLSFVTGLGRGLTAGGPLSLEGRRRVEAALHECLAVAQLYGVRELRAVGTAAWRDACDGAAFAEKLLHELGIPVEIISGLTEAARTWQGVMAGLQQAGLQQTTHQQTPHQPQPSPLAHAEVIQVLDIGGRSTELMMGDAKGLHWRHSYPMGTLSLTERFLKTPDEHTPVSQDQLITLQQHVDALLQATPPPVRLFSPESEAGEVIGVAATALTFAQLCHPTVSLEALEGALVSAQALDEQISRLAERSVAERRCLAGLEPARAEPILAGGMLLKAFMQRLHCHGLRITHWGLRHGNAMQTLPVVSSLP